MERDGGDDGGGGEAAPFPAMMDLLVVSEEASFPANCRPHLSSLPFFADIGIEGPLKLITGSIDLKLTVVASIHKANIENLQDICTEDALWLSNKLLVEAENTLLRRKEIAGMSKSAAANQRTSLSPKN
nr:hypothetical protein Iba_chr07bCG6530 [Ipomoea batatas]